MGMKTLVGLIGGIAVAAVVAAGAWYVFIRDDAPEETTLAGALSTLNTPAATTASTTAAGTTAAGSGATTTPATTTSASSFADINGNWTIDSAQANYTGYRVQEELVRVGATTAVGRTSAVTGTAVITSDKLQSVTITADLTQLKSDQDNRDNQLKTQGIETNKFPTATFTLTAPMDISDGLESGQTVKTTVTGTLLLHGVTREISMPVEAVVTNGLLVIVGTTPIEFGDYDIDAPSAGSVVSVDESAIMELQLFLKKG